MSLNQTIEALQQKFPLADHKLPIVFVGHGSPMNAIEENEFSRAWADVGHKLPRPNAILCVSAHWQTVGTRVTGMEKPQTIHDFGGFPKALYEAVYPAPGSPELAHFTREIVQQAEVQVDQNWGLDHGTWSVLRQMFPEADVPVVQMSLDATQPAEHHYALARELRTLRERGVLVVGSGNIVHRLQAFRVEDVPYQWALEFDDTARRLIESGDHQSLVHYEKLGRAAQLSIPTNEHYLPLLYVLALQDGQEKAQFFAEKVTFGAISMRSVLLS
jgi:4,5-DOPA dioxygenase extradiol